MILLKGPLWRTGLCVERVLAEMEGWKEMLAFDAEESEGFKLDPVGSEESGVGCAVEVEMVPFVVGLIMVGVGDRPSHSEEEWLVVGLGCSLVVSVSPSPSSSSSTFDSRLQRKNLSTFSRACGYF